MTKLKVGVIGAGGIAQAAHIPSWNKTGTAAVEAVADINATKLAYVQEKFAVPQGFSDYQELLALDEIDVVSICTPNMLHVEMSIAALRAGKHVLCEKPIATVGADAERIFVEAEKAGRLFMGAFCRRFTPEAQLLKRYVELGEFGDIYHAKAGVCRRRGIPGLGGWFTTKARSGGGCMLDIGVHALDRCYWQIGAPEPLSVTGAVYQQFADVAEDGGWPPQESRVGDVFAGTNDVEDMAVGQIRFSDGLTMVVEASWAANLEPKQYETILGTKSGATVDDSGLRLFTSKHGGLVDLKPKTPSGDGFLNEVLHFIECIEQDKKPITTEREIVNVAYIIEAIYRSAAEKREVQIAELRS